MENGDRRRQEWIFTYLAAYFNRMSVEMFDGFLETNESFKLEEEQELLGIITGNGTSK